MKLLALETANEQCSVSIVDETQELFFQLDARAKAQTQTILPMIEQGFAETQISTADVPVIPVSTLQALAQAAYRLEGLTAVTAVLDARMNEVYIASFELDAQGIMQAVDQEQLLNYSDAIQTVRFQLVGSGAGLIDQEQIQYKGLSATAQDIATIARVCAQQQQWVSAEIGRA